MSCRRQHADFRYHSKRYSFKNDIPRIETPDITSSANTEEKAGEPTGSGVASATDGDSKTYFGIPTEYDRLQCKRESNPGNPDPVDLGKSVMDIGGFKFNRRPSK